MLYFIIGSHAPQSQNATSKSFGVFLSYKNILYLQMELPFLFKRMSVPSERENAFAIHHRFQYLTMSNSFTLCSKIQIFTSYKFDIKMVMYTGKNKNECERATVQVTTC
jgi:hypothetical protein